MNNYKTLVILDWDDTLFPTSWLIKNNIDLTDKKVQYKYIIFFSRLDSILYKLLSNLSKLGYVLIVTNAMKKWVKITANVLPNTKKLFKDKVKIISARDLYQEKFPDEMYLWKKYVFKNFVQDYFKKKNTKISFL